MHVAYDNAPPIYDFCGKVRIIHDDPYLFRVSPTKPLNDAQMRGAFLYI